MFRKRSAQLIIGILTASLILISCSGPASTTAPVETPTTTEVATEVKGPTVLKIAVVMGSGVDEPWAKTQIQAIDRVAAKKPHGVSISYSITEKMWGDDAERAIRTYAETGEYDIIWPNASNSDQVKKVMNEFPDILFAYSGSGNEGLGGNAYWTYNHIHECAYLLGILAGSMTKTNVIGAVAGFPYDDVNDVLNGYKDGALSVNPNVKMKITFIESWYDPAKAKEATYAIIAAGADYIYGERYGVLDALTEKGVFGFGQYEDQHSLAPQAVVSSTLLQWDPVVEYLVEQWWNHKTTGKPYNAPTDPVWFPMAKGSCDIAPYYNFATTIPQNVKDAVSIAREDILSGKLVIPLKVEEPKSDQ